MKWPRRREPMPTPGDDWDGELATLEQGTLVMATSLRDLAAVNGIPDWLAEQYIEILNVQMGTIRKLHGIIRAR